MLIMYLYLFLREFFFQQYIVEYRQTLIPTSNTMIPYTLKIILQPKSFIILFNCHVEEYCKVLVINRAFNSKYSFNVYFYQIQSIYIIVTALLKSEFHYLRIKIVIKCDTFKSIILYQFSRFIVYSSVINLSVLFTKFREKRGVI